MAAITTERTPVQGCTVERLGAMRYQPMAAPAFAARWFPDGLTAAALSVAPLVVFDAKDRMQHRVLRRHGVTTDPPIHLVPASTQYVEAVRLGFGWGMVPDLQRAGWTSCGRRGAVHAADAEEVALFWQQWALRTPSLEQVAAAIRAASARSCAGLGRVRRSDSSADPVGAPCRGCAEPRIVGDMGNSPLSTILLIALMVVAFYFLLLRPQKKRQQAQQKTMNEIVPGTRVLLGSGIFGTIVSAGEKQAVLETSPGVHVTVLKQAIARVIRPGDEFSEPTETEDEIDDEIVDQDAVEPLHSR